MQVGQENAVAFEFPHDLLHFGPAVFEFLHAIHFPCLPGFFVKIERLVQQRSGEIEQVRRSNDGHLNDEPCIIVMEVCWHREAAHALQAYFAEAQVAVPLAKVGLVGPEKLCSPWLNSFLAVQEPDATIYTEPRLSPSSA